MKVPKERFDNLLSKLLRAKPEPRKKMKPEGKHRLKTPMPPRA
jgi:hypothetical protein